MRALPRKGGRSAVPMGAAGVAERSESRSPVPTATRPRLARTKGRSGIPGSPRWPAGTRRRPWPSRREGRWAKLARGEGGSRDAREVPFLKIPQAQSGVERPRAHRGAERNSRSRDTTQTATARRFRAEPRSAREQGCRTPKAHPWAGEAPPAKVGPYGPTAIRTPGGPLKAGRGPTHGGRKPAGGPD